MSESSTPKSLKAQITRTSLVLAAAALLREEGPKAVTYRKVAKWAGAASSSVGYYFDSVTELLHEAGMYNIQLWAQRAERVADLCEKLEPEECRARSTELLTRACLPDDSIVPKAHYAQLIGAADSSVVTEAYRKGRVLLDAAIAAKIALSDAEAAHVEVGGWQGDITRSQFNDLIAPLVKRTLMACRRALKDAGVEAQEVLEVVMVGGSTRVPLVRERVGEFFGRTPLTSIDPDKVVAIGAAIQADILVGNKPDSELLLLDVIPLSLGLETMGGLVEKVIPRNTTIPVARAQEFTTFKDGQTAMSIHVMQGERELVQDCRSLARFALRGIPALPAGGAHIRVTFQVDADGLLSVTAMEKSTGVEASIQVKPSYGLTDGEIATMIKDSMSYAEQDIQARMLAEQKVEAARVLESLTSALAADAALLSAAERQAIDAAAEQVRAAAAGDDADAIKEAIKNIDTQTQEFAARRMDQSVRIALKGQSVDEV